MKISVEDVEGELDTSVSYSFSSTSSSNPMNENTHPLQSTFEHFLQSYYSNPNSNLNSTNDSIFTNNSNKHEDNPTGVKKLTSSDVENISLKELVTFFQKKDDEALCGHIEGQPLLFFKNDKDLLDGLTMAQELNKSLKFSVQPISEVPAIDHSKCELVLDERFQQLKSEFTETIGVLVKNQVDAAKKELKSDLLHEIEIQSKSQTLEESSQASSQILRIPTSAIISHSAFCDICDFEIVTVRYKCINCKDFDLCESCEKIENVHNSSHIFLKIKEPLNQKLKITITNGSEKAEESEEKSIMTDENAEEPEKKSIMTDEKTEEVKPLILKKGRQMPVNYILQASHDGNRILFDDSMSLVNCPVFRGQKGTVISIQFLLSNEDSYKWPSVKCDLVYSSLPELIVKHPRTYRIRGGIHPKTTRNFHLRVKVPSDDYEVCESTWRLLCDNKVFGPLIVFRVTSNDCLLEDTNQPNNLAQNYVPQVFDFWPHVIHSTRNHTKRAMKPSECISFAPSNLPNKSGSSKLEHLKLLRKRTRFFPASKSFSAEAPSLIKGLQSDEESATGATDEQSDSMPFLKPLMPKPASDLCDFPVISEKKDPKPSSEPLEAKTTASVSNQKTPSKSETDDLVESTIKVTADVFSLAINAGKAAIRLFSEDLQKFNQNTQNRFTEAFESNAAATFLPNMHEKKTSPTFKPPQQFFSEVPVSQTVPFFAENPFFNVTESTSPSKPTAPEASTSRASTFSGFSMDKSIDQSDDSSEKESNVAMLGSALSGLSIEKETDSLEDAAEKESNVALTTSTTSILSATSIEKQADILDDHLSDKLVDLSLSSQPKRLVNSPVPSQVSEGSSYEMVMSDDFDFEAEEDRLILSTYVQPAEPIVKLIEEDSNTLVMNNSTHSMYSSLSESFEKATLVDKSQEQNVVKVTFDNTPEPKIAEINVQQLNLTKPTEEEKILAFLKESGFTDLAKNKQLIQKHDGKINFIINDLLEL